MKEIVISIFPDGRIEHTRDAVLTIPGHKEIVRVTEIEFDNFEQCFYVRWLRGPYAGKVLTNTQQRLWGFGPYIETSEPGMFYGEQRPRGDRIVYFDTYERAVAREIEMLNAMRLGGISFQ